MPDETQKVCRCSDCGDEKVCLRCSGVNAKMRRLEDENSKLRRQLGQVGGHLAKVQRRTRTGSPTEEGYSRQDIVLDDLERRFPGNRLVRINRGQYGSDALFYVRYDRSETRPILVEVKNTLNWGSDWTAKLKQHMEQHGSGIGVIVSEALPPGISTFGIHDDVFVSAFERATDLIFMLRLLAIEAHRAEVASIRQSASAEGTAALDYLTGKFGDRMEEWIKIGMAMLADLPSEKRAITRVLQQWWTKREKDLMRLLGVVDAVADDLIGAGIPLPAALQPGKDGPGEIVGLPSTVDDSFGGSGTITDLPSPFGSSEMIVDDDGTFVFPAPPGIEETLRRC